MLKKCIALFLSIGLWASIVSIAQAGYLPPPGSPFPMSESPFLNNNGTTVRTLSYFTSIVLSGNIDVDIKTGSSSSAVILTGDPETIKQVETTVSNDTLTVNLPSSLFSFNRSAPKVHAEIDTRYLNDLTLRNYTGRLQAVGLNAPYLNLDLDNSGTVLLSGKLGVNQIRVGGTGYTQIKGVNSQFVSIHMQGSPTVDLSGAADIQSIDASGSGRLRFYWVDSRNLQINQSGSTSIELAGVVQHLMLHLKDSAHFNGRYLRTMVGYAKTKDKSVADVQFLKSQAVLANDDSTISFYGTPPYKADFMGRNGAVLDMNDH